MMEEVIDGMTKDLDKSNSLLEKKNMQLQKIGTELQAQKHDLDRQMDEQKNRLLCKQTGNFPILQDFVSSQGRWPKRFLFEKMLLDDAKYFQ